MIIYFLFCFLEKQKRSKKELRREKKAKIVTSKPKTNDLRHFSMRKILRFLTVYALGFLMRFFTTELMLCNSIYCNTNGRSEFTNNSR